MKGVGFTKIARNMLTTVETLTVVDNNEFYSKLCVLYFFIKEKVDLERNTHRNIAEVINWLVGHGVISYLLEYFYWQEALEFIQFFKKHEKVYEKTMSFVQAMNALRFDEIGDSIVHYAIKNNYIDIVYYAIRSDYVGIVSDLFADGVNCNIKNRQGDSILHTFLNTENFVKNHVGCMNFIAYLVSKGFDVTVTNNQEQSILHYAVMSQNEEFIAFLYDQMQERLLQIEYGIEYGHTIPEDAINTVKFRILHSKDCYGKIPLHYAVEAGNIEATKFLLNKGSDVNFQDTFLITPLGFVKTQEMMNLLVDDKGADINALNIENKSPFFMILDNYCSIKRSDNELFAIIKYFITKQPILCIYFQKFLIKLNDYYGVKSRLFKDLLQQMKNYLGFTDYHIASLFNDISMLHEDKNIICDINAVDVNGYNALHFAISYEMAKCLIDLGVDINCQTYAGLTLLHRIVLNQKKDILSEIFDAMENEQIYKMITTQTHDAYTPLHFALKYRNVGCAFTILDVISKNIEENIKENECIDVINAVTADGFTALHFACQNDYFTIVEKLIALGASVRSMDWKTQPLHIACRTQYRNLNIVKLLIAKSLKDIVEDKDDFMRTPLFYAIENDDIEIVKHLFANFANVDVTDCLGKVPLHLVKTKEIAELLICNKADIDFLDKQGCTPIVEILHNFHKNAINIYYLELIKYLITLKPFLCCKCQRYFIAIKQVMPVNLFDELLTHIQKVFNFNRFHMIAFFNDMALLDKKIGNLGKINNLDVRGYVPLYFAINSDMIKYLTDLKASVNFIDDQGFMLLCRALENKNANLLKEYGDKIFLQKILLKHLKFKNFDGYTLLHIATMFNSEECFAILLEYYDSFDIDVVNEISKNGFRAIHFACYNENLYMVNELLERKIKIDCENNTIQPLHIACQSGNLEIVKILVQQGADINILNERGFTPVHVTLYYNHLTIADYLINQGADINVCSIHGITLLHVASRHGHLSIVKYLIDKGMDVNVQDERGFTPLYIASYSGCLSVVECLLENKATNVNACSKKGETPLHIASKYGHFLIVKHLVTKGANIHAKNQYKETTALHYALWFGHLLVIKYLLAKGADINEKFSQDRTALHLASQRGHLPVVEFLITKGADIYAKNEQGFTPFDIALQERHVPIAVLLTTQKMSIEHNASVSLLEQKENIKVQNSNNNTTERNDVLELFFSTFDKQLNLLDREFNFEM